MSILKNKRKIILICASLLLVAALLFGAAWIYVSDYYRADLEAIEAFGEWDDATLKSLDNGALALEVPGATAGLIFYPGGKVEYTAYLPLMIACRERGITSVVCEMPFNLAVLDINAADGIFEQFPEIESWYIGGHSLGGSMAASYAAKNPENVDGLVLLGAYSTADLSLSGLKVLSVYGSCDGVMNREKYENSRKNLPMGFTEVVIEGGSHAYFGMYGEQSGDGEASISAEEQINLTADCIADLINQ